MAKFERKATEPTRAKGVDGGGWFVTCRQEGESVLFGTEIQVKVMRARKGQVKLAIRAPNVKITVVQAPSEGH